MIQLRYRYNAVFKSISENSAPSHEHLPVLTKTGDFERMPWRGFIDLEDALKIEGAKPVKLDVYQYSTSVAATPKWQNVTEGMAVQGCLTSLGVYAVVDNGRLRMVPRPCAG
ncbi:hypothetical protein [Zhongshania sp.]|jgi:hypothetical protein|uniref:hypothetical protein n=1 Tax=Zhongshania sp. TaxID=1971902 RepID=UPI002A81ABE4|nr:hypothetical protein [Zhongshania sp.]